MIIANSCDEFKKTKKLTRLNKITITSKRYNRVANIALEIKR